MLITVYSIFDLKKGECECDSRGSACMNLMHITVNVSEVYGPISDRLRNPFPLIPIDLPGGSALCA